MLDLQITVNGNISLKTVKKLETHPCVRNLRYHLWHNRTVRTTNAYSKFHTKSKTECTLGLCEWKKTMTKEKRNCITWKVDKITFRHRNHSLVRLRHDQNI